MCRWRYWRVLTLLAPLGVAILACGSGGNSDSSPNPDAGPYRYTLGSGSTISTSDGDWEELRGTILASLLDLGPNYIFAVKIERLDLRSPSFVITGSEGQIIARTTFALEVSAPVEINGEVAELDGINPLDTYYEPGRIRKVPKEFRGVVLRVDEDVTLTLYASR